MEVKCLLYGSIFLMNIHSAILLVLEVVHNGLCGWLIHVVVWVPKRNQFLIIVFSTCELICLLQYLFFFTDDFYGLKQLHTLYRLI